MMILKKTKGVVTGVLAVALSFGMIGSANAIVTVVESVTSQAPTVVAVNANSIELTDQTTGCVAAGGTPQYTSVQLNPNMGPALTEFAANDATGTYVVTAAIPGNYQYQIDCRSGNDIYRTTWNLTFAFGNIVEVAEGNNPEFTTLLAAVTAADLGGTSDLVGTLSNPAASLTVFAPTNAAFEALDPALLAKLLLPENRDLLIQILTYHVLGSKVMSTDITEGRTDQTLNGQSVSFTLTDGVKVQGANVIAADVPATNGVIHVIDKVLLPPNLDLSRFDAPTTVVPPAVVAAKKYTVTVTGFAFKKKGASTVDNNRAAAVSSYLNGLGLNATNSSYVVSGKEVRKSAKSARSALVSVSYVGTDGKTITVTKRIYFSAQKITLTKKAKTSLNALYALVK